MHNATTGQYYQGPGLQNISQSVRNRKMSCASGAKKRERLALNLLQTNDGGFISTIRYDLISL
uniref:Putative ovule protein n=1 Tax=Solanum chacoense TaxID=4108 RepID=A0A0V0GZA9_SOLCH